jgi:hypothetical protein
MRSSGGAIRGGTGRESPTTTGRGVAALACGLLAVAALTGCDAARGVFPKAFPSESTTPTPAVRATAAPDGAWKTVTTRAGDMSFRIRDDWSVEPAPAREGTSSTGIPAYRVFNADGTEIAVLQQNPGATTSAALPGSTFTQLDSVPAPGADLLVDASKSQVRFDLTTHPNGDSEASYGLTSGVPVSAATAPGGQVPLGGGVQGTPKLAGPLVFQGLLALGPNERTPSQQDKALEAAKAYLMGQEYADLTAMFLSLDHHPERATGTRCDGSAFTYTTVNIDCGTVLGVYHTARIAERYDSRSGSTVRVMGDYLCSLKELGAKLDGVRKGEGVDGTCRVDGGYGSFTATWKS